MTDAVKKYTTENIGDLSLEVESKKSSPDPQSYVNSQQSDFQATSNEDSQVYGSYGNLSSTENSKTLESGESSEKSQIQDDLEKVMFPAKLNCLLFLMNMKRFAHVPIPEYCHFLAC